MKAAVIGAGPAGISAALGLIDLGIEVDIYEQRPQWSGRVCGAFLSSEACHYLDKLHLMDPLITEGAVAVPMTKIYLSEKTSLHFETNSKKDYSRSISRKGLENLLTMKLREQGGNLHLGTRLVSHEFLDPRWRLDLRNEKGQPISVKTDILVLADGRFSAARAVSKSSSGWYGWNAAFENCAQKPGEQSLHFYLNGYVGCVTFHDGTTNLCGLTYRTSDQRKDASHLFEEALLHAPHLKPLTGSAKRIGEWRGVGPLPFLNKYPHTPAFLVGDAAAVGDPFMGEGIGRALGAGPLLNQAFQPKGSMKLLEPHVAQKNYSVLWKKKYSSRLFVGSLIRKLLRSPSGLGLLRLIMKRPFITNQIIQKIHKN